MFRRFAVFSVIVLLLGATPAIGDIVTGLEAYYAFDNPLHPADDTSGNDRDGVISGAELVIDPVRLVAMSFSGDDSISGSLSGSAISSAGVTVALWAYTTTAITGNDGLFVANAGVADNKTIGGWVNSSNQIWGRIRVGGNKSLPTDSDAVISSGTWTHIAFRGDGSQYEVIVDGTPTGNYVAYSGSLDETITDLLVGRQGTESWQGLIDDFRVYSRALSNSDVAELVNLTATRQYAPHVAFDADGTGTADTQAGFTSLPGNGAASAESLLTTASISSSLDESRDRGTGGTLDGSERYYDLLRDFVFENDGQPAEIGISGLMPDMEYFVTVYSFDSNGNNGTQTEWYQDAISGSPLYTHTIDSYDPDAASFTLSLFSDSEGVITLFAQPAGGGSGIVIFNGLEIDMVPEPSTFALLPGLAGVGLVGCLRRRRTR